MYTNYNDPEIDKAAGVYVASPEGVTSSGRPAFSKGFLVEARERTEQNVNALVPDVRDGWDVVVCEPSDAVMFQSDYPDFVGINVETVAECTYGICEYLDVYHLDERLEIETRPSA